MIATEMRPPPIKQTGFFLSKHYLRMSTKSGHEFSKQLQISNPERKSVDFFSHLKPDGNIQCRNGGCFNWLTLKSLHEKLVVSPNIHLKTGCFLGLAKSSYISAPINSQLRANGCQCCHLGHGSLWSP